MSIEVIINMQETSLILMVVCVAIVSFSRLKPTWLQLYTVIPTFILSLGVLVATTVIRI